MSPLRTYIVKGRRQKAPVVSLRRKLYPYCLVLVGSRNGFERDSTIELNKLRALWKIDLNVKYAHSFNIVQTKRRITVDCWIYKVNIL